MKMQLESHSKVTKKFITCSTVKIYNMDYKKIIFYFQFVDKNVQISRQMEDDDNEDNNKYENITVTNQNLLKKNNSEKCCTELNNNTGKR